MPARLSSSNYHIQPPTLRAARLSRKRSCSVRGSTKGARRVMFALMAAPAMEIRFLSR